MKRILLSGIVLSLAVGSQALAAPSGTYKFQVQTKNAWPITVKINNGQFSMLNNGYVNVLGASQTSSNSDKKIVGKTNFTTKICNQKSSVTITLKFNADGTYKSGKASGRCNRTTGGVQFSGRIVSAQ